MISLQAISRFVYSATGNDRRSIEKTIPKSISASDYATERCSHHICIVLITRFQLRRDTPSLPQCSTPRKYQGVCFSSCSRFSPLIPRQETCRAVLYSKAIPIRLAMLVLGVLIQRCLFRCRLEGLEASLALESLSGLVLRRNRSVTATNGR
jgi:hypothetical protein